MWQLFPPEGGTLTATYDYVDELGQLLYQVLRYEPKAFRQGRSDGRGGWIWNLAGVRLVLYRLPEVMKAETVLIVEGEKDVETAYQLGLPAGVAATTSVLGACQWRSEYSEMLRGRRVVIAPDNDRAGREHLGQIIRDLEGKATEIRVLKFPASARDLSDWVDKGGTAQQLVELIRTAQPVGKP